MAMLIADPTVFYAPRSEVKLLVSLVAYTLVLLAPAPSSSPVTGNRP